MTAPLGLASPWIWVQPKPEEILPRLRDCFELNVHERERENMCSVAYGEIVRLRATLLRIERIEGRSDELRGSGMVDDHDLKAMRAMAEISRAALGRDAK